MTTHEKLIKAKLNLLDLASYLGNVSEACRTLGYSRDTFYRVTQKGDHRPAKVFILFRGKMAQNKMVFLWVKYTRYILIR